MIKKIFVNASAAKSFGAKTILDKFVAEKGKEKDVIYVIASPVMPNRISDNQIWIEKNTHSFGTILYALLGSWFDSRKNGCQSIISFSNINSVLPVAKITYFQNMLILNGNEFKWRVIRWLLGLNLRSNKIIVQTPYVKEQFHKLFGLKCKVEVCWPGIDDFFLPGLDNRKSPSTIKRSSTYKILVPIPDPALAHKNFSLVLKIAKKCLDYPIQFIVTSEMQETYKGVVSNVIYVGKKDQSGYLALLDSVDATLVTSTLETVGLPIFESLSCNKYCFVFKQDYLKGIYDLFGDLEGILKFSDEDEFIQAYLKAQAPFPKLNSSFKDGNWNF